jgi:hypothetical protein
VTIDVGSRIHPEPEARLIERGHQFGSIVFERSDHDLGSDVAPPRATINDKVVSDPVDRYEPVRASKRTDEGQIIVRTVREDRRSMDEQVDSVDEILELLGRGGERVLVLDFVAVPIESAQYGGVGDSHPMQLLHPHREAPPAFLSERV